MYSSAPIHLERFRAVSRPSPLAPSCGGASPPGRSVAGDAQEAARNRSKRVGALMPTGPQA
eukprot:6009427-Alexandrium_andersonii.AAC.1